MFPVVLVLAAMVAVLNWILESLAHSIQLFTFHDYLLLIRTALSSAPVIIRSAQITRELGLQELRERNWQILPCSAKDGTGLQEGMCNVFVCVQVCEHVCRCV